MKVPLRNLYYLLCYAWEHVVARDLARFEAVNADRPEDLLAKILIDGTSYALRRGLDREYLTEEADISGIRGKLEVSEMTKRVLWLRGQAACRYDELSHDTRCNRILKQTLVTLARVSSLDRRLRRELHKLVRRLSEISTSKLTTDSFRNIRIHRNNSHYRLLLSTCELIFNNLLLEPRTGLHQFRDFRDDDQSMGRIFEEEFVRSFLRREQDRFRVSRDSIEWSQDVESPSAHWLPWMKTDITLRDPIQTIVIETKYYAQPLQEQFSKKSVRSEHLYQLFAYLKNLEAQGGPDSNASGVLLYPTVDLRLDFHFRIHGHDMHVKGLDLDQPWQRIHADLLQVVEAVAR